MRGTVKVPLLLIVAAIVGVLTETCPTAVPLSLVHTAFALPFTETLVA